MAFLRRILVLYRLPIAILLIILGVFITMQTKSGIYVSWLFFLIAILISLLNGFTTYCNYLTTKLEAGDGIEPSHKGFAGPCITTLLLGHMLQQLKQQEIMKVNIYFATFHQSAPSFAYFSTNLKIFAS